MHPDTLVLVEWYDQFIPPRHHFMVARYGSAIEGIRQGWTLAIHPLDPELLVDEAPPTRR